MADCENRATPRITVVMAVYEPNREWLREQLRSLEGQTLAPSLLLLRDDHSPSFTLDELEQLAAECITRFPVRCERSEENRGSNATFAQLTREAEGDYIAYCDQDDIWEPDKLRRLADVLSQPGVTLSCCDLSVMDGQGRQTARSITQVKPHIVYRSGTGLAPLFLTENFVTGCALLMPVALAQEALPFVRSMVHDQWLGLWAASKGRIAGVAEPLVRYRIHDDNQTHTLARIESKKDYYEKRVLPFAARMKELRGRIDLGQPQRQAESWADVRAALYRKEKGAWRRLAALRHVNGKISCFELALPLMPPPLFRLALRLIQKGAM